MSWGDSTVSKKAYLIMRMHSWENITMLPEDKRLSLPNFSMKRPHPNCIGYVEIYDSLDVAIAVCKEAGIDEDKIVPIAYG